MISTFLGCYLLHYIQAMLMMLRLLTSGRWGSSSTCSCVVLLLSRQAFTFLLQYCRVFFFITPRCVLALLAVPFALLAVPFALLSVPFALLSEPFALLIIAHRVPHESASICWIRNCIKAYQIYPDLDPQPVLRSVSPLFLVPVRSRSGFHFEC